MINYLYFLYLLDLKLPIVSFRKFLYITFCLLPLILV